MQNRSLNYYSQHLAVDLMVNLEDLNWKYYESVLVVAVALYWAAEAVLLLVVLPFENQNKKTKSKKNQKLQKKRRVPIGAVGAGRFIAS